MVKWRKNNDNDDDKEIVIVIVLRNIDVDHVQTSSNNSVGIANGHSWSLIMPHLGLNVNKLFVKFNPWI